MEQLRAKLYEVNRGHMQVRAQQVLAQVKEAMRQSGIRGMIRAQMGPTGRPEVLVRVQGMGAVEAYLSLPPVLDGFRVRVV